MGSKKMATEAIPDYKKDWKLCAGCLCANDYCISPSACAMTDLAVCLCLANDMACLPVPDNIPKACNCLPGCFIYPKMVCCPKVSAMYEGKELEDLGGRKDDFTMVSSCCLGPCVASNCYCIMPYTLCANEESTC